MFSSRIKRLPQLLLLLSLSSCEGPLAVPSQGSVEALQAEARSYQREHALRLALESELKATRERVDNLERAGMRMSQRLSEIDDECSERVWKQYQDDRDAWSCTCYVTPEINFGL